MGLISHVEKYGFLCKSITPVDVPIIVDDVKCSDVVKLFHIILNYE